MNDLLLHYQLTDTLLSCMAEERHMGFPADDKGKAQRKTAVENFHRVLTDFRKRFFQLSGGKAGAVPAGHFRYGEYRTACLDPNAEHLCAHWKRREERMSQPSRKEEQFQLLHEINRVEGFDPAAFAVEYTDMNTGEVRKRLPVMIQMAWFRLKYPEGRIAVEVTPAKDCFVAKGPGLSQL